MDILFAHDFPPMGGGIARWMDAIARGYPPGELIVSTGRLPGSAESDAARLQRVDRVPVSAHRLRLVPGAICWSWRAITLARDSHARFAWCDSVRPAGHPARWARRVAGLPYGILVHGGDVLTLERRLASGHAKRRIIHSILGAASVFVANSHWTADRCRSLLGRAGLADARHRVRVVVLGTNPDQWHATPAQVDAFRQRHGLPVGHWLISVSRLVAYKGLDAALRVFAALTPAHGDLRYLIVGSGDYASALRDLAGALGIADRVYFVTDLDDGELPAAYASADVYVGLTRETATDVEGFGIAFVEAAAAGLPVVATRSGGIPDAVADGITGWLVPVDDVAAAADAVDQLLRDAVRAGAMGRAGRDRVAQYLNWGRVVSEMRAIAAEHGR